jgi:TonB family protein
MRSVPRGEHLPVTSSSKLAVRAPDPPDNPGVVSAPRPGATLVVLSQADEFLLEIGLALQGLATVRPVDDLAEALQALREETVPRSLAVDARSLDAALATLEAATLETPQVPVLLFSPANVRQELAALSPDPRITLLPMPFEPEPTAQALRRAIQAAGITTILVPAPAAAPRARIAATPVEPRSPPVPASNGEGPRNRSRTVVPWIAAGAAVLAVAAGAYWTLGSRSVGNRSTPHPTPISPLEGVPRPNDPTIVQGRLDDLLAKARAAMRAHRYTDPAADNAFLYYRSAIAVDPASAEARDGLRRIGGVLDQRFQSALAAGHLNQADAALTTLSAALPDHPALAAERLQYASALQARQAAIAAQQQAQANAQRLAGLVEARIRSGELAGGTDSASAYAAQLAAAAPANPLTASTLADLHAAEARTAALAAAAAQARANATDAARARDPHAAGLDAVGATLEQRLLGRARSAALAGHADVRDLAAARSLGADSQALASVQAALASRRAASARAHAAPALRLVRGYTPRYPYDALDRHVSGSVVVAFVVDPHGRTRDVHVLASSPHGVFEHAATDAVERWRYAPPTLDGKPASVPARIEIRFAPPR